MKAWIKFIVLTGASLTIYGCFSNRQVISQRPVGGGSESTQISGRDVAATATPPQDVYTKQNTLSIKPIKKSNTSGSLTNLEDPRSYLLASTAPLVVGSFLDIKTITASEAAKTGGSKTTPPASQPTEQIENELLKSLPNLDPAAGDPEKPTVLAGFKAEVLEILDNGDAIIGYHRRSVRGDQASDFLVKARVPQASLLDKESLTTSNLVDVEFRESREGEISERHSSRWEDEYTLRMSGFDEARSKSAVAIEDQRRQIKDTRDKLATQIKAFSTERQTVAKERNDYMNKKKEDDEKMAELERKVKEQSEELEKIKQQEAEKAADDAAKLTEDPAKAKGSNSTKPGTVPPAKAPTTKPDNSAKGAKK